MGTLKAQFILHMDNLQLERTTASFSKLSSYEDFMAFDHYKINQSQNQGENNTILPKVISSKKQKYLMMPKNHYEEKYWYYDSVKNISPLPRDLRTQFYNKEKLNKVQNLF